MNCSQQAESGFGLAGSGLYDCRDASLRSVAYRGRRSRPGRTLMNGYKDAHTHIHPSPTATRAFKPEFLGPFGRIEQALPIIDQAGS